MPQTKTTNPRSTKTGKSPHGKKVRIQGAPKRRHKPRRATHAKDFTDKYSIKEKLGHGNFAEVYRVVRRTDRAEFACKIIRKEKVPPDELDDLINEVQILTKLDGHPHCVHTVEVIDSTRKLYIVMEVLRGGELFKQICAQGHFSEQMASECIRQIGLALQHMHSKGVTHRDLKPENLMYKEPYKEGTPGTLVVTDFGLASQVAQMETACGSPMYAAPEVLGTIRAYNNQCDMWSLGVITYILLCGYPPFYHENIMQMYKFIRRGEYEFPEEDWGQISDGAKSIIKRMLVVDPADRLTVEQLLADKWITHSHTLSTEPLPLRMLKNLRKYMLRGRMRKAVHAVMAVLALKDALDIVEAEEEANGFSKFSMVATERLRHVKELDLDDFTNWAEDHFGDEPSTAQRVTMVARHLWQPGEGRASYDRTGTGRHIHTLNLRNLHREDFEKEEWRDSKGGMHHLDDGDIEEVMLVLHPRVYKDGDWVKAHWNGKWHYARVTGFDHSSYDIEVENPVDNSDKCRQGETKPRISKTHLRGFVEADLQPISEDANICKWQGHWVNSEGVQFQLRGNECKLVSSSDRFHIYPCNEPGMEGYYKMNKWGLAPADIRHDQIIWRRSGRDPIHWYHKTHDELMKIREAFNLFDRDDSGAICTKEMSHVLKEIWGRKPTRFEVEELFHKYDLNRDGKIQFDEFVEMFGAMGLDKLEAMSP